MHDSKFKVSEETLKLEAFFATVPAGARVLYVDIEAATGVKMTLSGRAKIRTALRRLDRIATPVRGEGIELSGATNADNINADNARRMIQATKKTNRQAVALLVSHGTEMSADTRQRGTLLAAATGALLQAAENNRKLYDLRQPVPTRLTVIPIPQVG